ncbi:MAG TPA: type II toxin-antitoxin system HicA family toxin [Candidatus Hydrogenedentes bacterium]|nr:type II toxin-antitoxin system HicA family toxin [Candidatus Hydrogenedentota bacterium]
MPELRRMSGEEVCRLLQRHGFTEVRRWGSHIVMQRCEDAGTTTVPVPNHADLRTGTLRSILRQSGSSRSLFGA